MVDEPESLGSGWGSGFGCGSGDAYGGSRFGHGEWGYNSGWVVFDIHMPVWSNLYLDPEDE